MAETEGGKNPVLFCLFVYFVSLCFSDTQGPLFSPPCGGVRLTWATLVVCVGRVEGYEGFLSDWTGVPSVRQHYLM